jgi:hypothetical protein
MVDETEKPIRLLNFVSEEQVLSLSLSIETLVL